MCMLVFAPNLGALLLPFPLLFVALPAVYSLPILQGSAVTAALIKPVHGDLRVKVCETDSKGRVGGSDSARPTLSEGAAGRASLGSSTQGPLRGCMKPQGPNGSGSSPKQPGALWVFFLEARVEGDLF